MNVITNVVEGILLIPNTQIGGSYVRDYCIRKKKPGVKDDIDVIVSNEFTKTQLIKMLGFFGSIKIVEKKNQFQNNCIITIKNYKQIINVDCYVDTEFFVNQLTNVSCNNFRLTSSGITCLNLEKRTFVEQYFNCINNIFDIEGYKGHLLLPIELYVNYCLNYLNLTIELLTKGFEMHFNKHPSFVITTFNKIKNVKGGETEVIKEQIKENTCSICSQEYDETNDNLLITKCGHIFHYRCIKEWLNTSMNGLCNTNCPICRTYNFLI